VTLVFIVRTTLDPYPGFTDVIESAKRRANCPIWVISDQPDPGGVNYVPISEFPVGDEMRARFARQMNPWSCLTLARWYVLRDFIRKYDPPFPIICMDWDVMIFRDLGAAYAPFEECDYTVSVLDGLDSAAYGINRMEPLEAFCDMVEGISDDNRPEAQQLNDMLAWRLFRGTAAWKVGDLFEIRDGSVFDHNIHCGADRFRMEGEAKQVVFLGGTPYFVALDGSLVVANTIHCWGTYKTRTRELMYSSFIDRDSVEGAEWYSDTEEFGAVLGLSGSHSRSDVVTVGRGAGINALAFKHAGVRSARAVEQDAGQSIDRLIYAGEAAADIVFTREALHRSRDAATFAKECASLLRPGGVWIAAREPVVSNGDQSDEFLAQHSGAHERAYLLTEYLRMIGDAGLRTTRVLGPLDSVINNYPLEARTALRRKLGGLGVALSHVPPAYRWALRRIAPGAESAPGRLYTFVAVKR
jgi:hypothetical protein